VYRVNALYQGDDASIQLTLTCGSAPGGARAAAGVRASRPGSAWHTGALSIQVTRPPSTATTFQATTPAVSGWTPPPGTPAKHPDRMAATHLGHAAMGAHPAVIALVASLDGDLPAITTAAQDAEARAAEVETALAAFSQVAALERARAAATAAIAATREAATAVKAEVVKGTKTADISTDLTLRGKLVNAAVAWVRLADEIGQVATRAKLPEVPGEALYRHQIRAQTISRAVEIAERGYSRYLEQLQRDDSFGTGAGLTLLLHSVIRPALEQARDAVIVDPDPRVARLTADAQAYVELILAELALLDPAVKAYAQDNAQLPALGAAIAASVPRVVAAQQRYGASMTASLEPMELVSK